jgi:hypothetical protein
MGQGNDFRLGAALVDVLLSQRDQQLDRVGQLEFVQIGLGLIQVAILLIVCRDAAQAGIALGRRKRSALVARPASGREEADQQKDAKRRQHKRIMRPAPLHRATNAPV